MTSAPTILDPKIAKAVTRLNEACHDNFKGNGQQEHALFSVLFSKEGYAVVSIDDRRSVLALLSIMLAKEIDSLLDSDSSNGYSDMLTALAGELNNVKRSRSD